MSAFNGPCIFGTGGGWLHFSVLNETDHRTVRLRRCAQVIYSETNALLSSSVGSLGFHLKRCVMAETPNFEETIFVVEVVADEEYIAFFLVSSYTRRDRLEDHHIRAAWSSTPLQLTRA